MRGVADRVCTPAYVYNLDALRAQTSRFRAAFPKDRFSLLFATMANPLPAVLKALSAEGVGACVNSLAHMQAAIDHGIAKSLIQYTATGTGSRELTALVAAGVRANLDSASQVTGWRAAGGSKAGLRINTASLLGANPEQADRIGIHADELDALVTLARGANVTVEGLHIYVGTNFPSPSLMLPALKAFFEIAQRAPDLGMSISEAASA
ncbi:MAG: hypothetical protein IPL62_19130 [Caulobacteraceae bacterium]|nr:hypothetical protein [Caulobacteraceae bacterium]